MAGIKEAPVTQENELFDILRRSKRKRWIGQVLWQDCLQCLVRTVLDGRLEGKKGRQRSRRMLFSCLLKTKEENMDYTQLKELA